MVYLGNGLDVGDLHVMRIQPGQVDIVYELDEDDRKMIAEGGKVVLGIYAEPMPPVSVRVAHKDMYEPVGPHPFNVISNDG